MDEKIKEIDPYLRNLLTFDGFLALFYQFCKEYSTQEKAYEAAERIFQAYFCKRKYASFESFKNTRNQKFKKRKIIR
jgi:hypothetical protein